MKYIKYSLYGIVVSVLGVFLLLKLTGMNINDLALKTLGFIKKAKGDSVDISNLDNQESSMITHEEWSALLRKHVAENGDVNYKGFQDDIHSLNIYLDLLSNHPPGKNWPENDKLAYWINVYNAFTVKLILDNYPLESIKDISSGLPMINSPWDIKFFKIGGIDFDLNTVEHDILRKDFEEPRIHFAINCASFSCPKLRTEAFESDRLEEQLNDQARAFILNPHKNTLAENQTELSKIFSWFESDFSTVGGVQSFIKKYKEDFNLQSTISYKDYDWSLNSQS